MRCIYVEYITRSHDQKSNVAPYFNCLDLRNVMNPLTTLLASWDANTGANRVSAKKVDYMSVQLCLPKECNGAIDDATGSIWHLFQCQWHQLPTSNVVSHFNCLELGNAMVPLPTLLASHAARAGPNIVTWPKRSCTSFWSSGTNNAMMQLMVLSTSHDTDTDTMVPHDSNANASGIIWCQSWCQWNNVAK